MVLEQKQENRIKQTQRKADGIVCMYSILASECRSPGKVPDLERIQIWDFSSRFWTTSPV